MSRILVMVKPWSMTHADEILAEMDSHGSRLSTGRLDDIKIEDMAALYEVHQARPNFTHMVTDFQGLSAIVAVYEANPDTFERLKGSLRAKYAADIPFNPNHRRNAFHMTSTEDEFKHDINVLGKYLPQQE